MEEALILITQITLIDKLKWEVEYIYIVIAIQLQYFHT